jgi:hypothetical protein
MSGKAISRRAWIASVIGGLIVGAAVGYLAKPREVIERIITSAVTVTNALWPNSTSLVSFV